ncbi:MAG: ROK family transcriptional regulator [Actinomycetaceae bacterium]|nr:ROK family transcriptional regulator [Actinomycetaceae bacterium]MDY6082618.1 ROK family transcriptional regulator [Actinomycetaceae bacterium]
MDSSDLASLIVQLLASSGARGMTREELYTQLAVSRTVLGRALDELIQEGSVQIRRIRGSEKTRTAKLGETHAGRPAQRVYLVDKKAYAIGIVLRKRHSTAVAVSRLGTVLSVVSIDRDFHINDSYPIEHILRTLCARLIEEARSIDLSQIQYVGIGLPVPTRLLDAQEYSETVVNIRAAVQEFWDAPCWIDNSVLDSALAEFALLRRTRSVQQPAVFSQLYIHVSGGISSSLVIAHDSGDQASFPVATSLGEFGHVTIPGHSALCYCGKRGCLETIASTAGLSFAAHMPSFDDVVAGYEAGDHACQAAYRDAVQAVSFALSITMIAVLPQVVVIGGDVAHAFRTFADDVQTKVSHEVTSALGRKPDFVRAGVTDVDAAFAAIDLARRNAAHHDVSTAHAAQIIQTHRPQR